MHESMRRLISAADKMYPGEIGSSAIARRIGEAPSTVTNWRVRGVSMPGAVMAELAYGISAAWILDGKDPIIKPWPFKKIDEEKVRQLPVSDLVSIETALILQAQSLFRIDIQREAVGGA